MEYEYESPLATSIISLSSLIWPGLVQVLGDLARLSSCEVEQVRSELM